MQVSGYDEIQHSREDLVNPLQNRPSQDSRLAVPQGIYCPNGPGIRSVLSSDQFFGPHSWGDELPKQFCSGA